MSKHENDYERILNAAKWAEKYQKSEGIFAPTWEVLYEVAAKVESGDLKLPKMSATDKGYWSYAVDFLKCNGIDVIALAHTKIGSIKPTITRL